MFTGHFITSCLGQIIQWKTTDVRMHRPKIGADVNMRIWF